jgi:hypothetical protein
MSESVTVETSEMDGILTATCKEENPLGDTLSTPAPLPLPRPRGRHFPQGLPSRSPDRKFHLVWLCLATGVVALSMLMQIRNSQQVTIPFTQIPLPELCSFRRMTGMDCAGCGMTRCFISLGHGDVPGAWNYNPAGVLLFGIVVFQIPFRAWQLWRIRRGLPELFLSHYGYSGMVLFAVLMVCQWGIKLAAHFL